MTARGPLRRRVRPAVDGALACVLVFVMATPLAEGVAHEWLGVALVVLAAIHQALNARWWSALLRGRQTPLRLLTTLVGLALVICVAALAASSLVISVHAFSWLPAIPGALWARPAHMLCSFWLFALSAFHAGLHVRVRCRPFGLASTALLVLWAVGALAGIASWIWLDFGSYLVGAVPFYAVDASQPLALRVLAYLLIGALLAGVGCALRLLLDAPRKGGRRAARLSHAEERKGNL